ncbi:MAG: CpaF family protein [Acidimicrobiia bacterium]|nr:CpaF family protein [Acidimicrobiia bacterium]
MKLGDRLRAAQAEQNSQGALRVSTDDLTTTVVQDPFALLKQRAQDALFARMGARLYDASLGSDQLDVLVVQELSRVVEEEHIPLDSSERARLVAEIRDDVLGFGAIEQWLADPDVTEIMVNALDGIYVERRGKIERTGSRYTSAEHLRQVIDRIVSRVGRRIDESSPMVDARLPDGSRVNAIIPPLAVDGPVLTVRKFAKQVYSDEDLVRLSTLTPELCELLAAGVSGKLNVLVTGGTGTGKTTLLNVLSQYIPETERVITIEDAVELRLVQEHVLRLEARPPNIEGKGEITIRDLVRNALRMRPDRIIVGEVRGGEALDMLQAMNTGHEGSLSTLHCNSPRDALARLETMVLMAGLDLPVRAIREQIASAVDLIVHLSRLRDGTRRVTQLTEVNTMEGDVITLTDLYVFDYAAGIDEHGHFRGNATPTGLRARFVDRLADQGIEIPNYCFGITERAPKGKMK